MRIAKNLRLMMMFIPSVLIGRVLYLGLAFSLTAFLVRAYINSSLIPFTIGSLTDNIIGNSVDPKYVIDTVFVLLSSAAVYFATEWMLKPYFEGRDLCGGGLG